MRNMLLIARREYLEQVRGRAFRMTTFGLPAVFAADHRRRLSLEPRPGIRTGIWRSLPTIRFWQTKSSRQLFGDKDAKATVDVIAPATPAPTAPHLIKRSSKQDDRRRAVG